MADIAGFVVIHDRIAYMAMRKWEDSVDAGLTKVGTLDGIADELEHFQATAGLGDTGDHMIGTVAVGGVPHVSVFNAGEAGAEDWWIARGFQRLGSGNTPGATPTVAIAISDPDAVKKLDVKAGNAGPADISDANGTNVRFSVTFANGDEAQNMGDAAQNYGLAQNSGGAGL